MESLKSQVRGRIVFLTIGEPGYSRSWTYFNGLRKMGVPVEFLQIPTKNPVKEIFSKRKEFNRKKDIFIVMNPSHYLTLPVRVFLGKNVILDAGWSLYEGTLSRGDRLERFFLVALKSIFTQCWARRVKTLSLTTIKFYFVTFLYTGSGITIGTLNTGSFGRTVVA
jgi:hypothetical protein